MITLHTGQTVGDTIYADTWASIQALWNNDATLHAVFIFANWARRQDLFQFPPEDAHVIAGRGLVTLVMQEGETRPLLHGEVKKVVDAAFEGFGMDLTLRHPVTGAFMGRFGPPLSAYTKPEEEQ